MTLVGWSILLFVLGALLIIAELILPAAGIIGVMGGGAVVAGVVVCFLISPLIGMVAATGAVAAAPGVWLLFLKLYPRTYVGRKTLLPPATPTESVLPVQIGQTGTAVSELKPMGICDFDGTRVEAHSEHGLLPVGTRVVIINLDQRRPVVRKI